MPSMLKSIFNHSVFPLTTSQQLFLNMPFLVRYHLPRLHLNRQTQYAK
jgi:hypothetical protein